MNSKIFFLSLFLLSGCGVKGDPKAPESNKMPSVIDDYSDIQIEKPLEDFKKR